MSNSDTCLGENEIEFGHGVTEGWAKTVGRVAGESLSEEVTFRLELEEQKAARQVNMARNRGPG